MSTWITKSGREIPIPELESGHLINIIQMLYRQAVERSTVMRKYDESQGIKKVYDWRDFVYAQFSELEAEAERRALMWFPVGVVDPDWSKLPIEDRPQMERVIGGAIKDAMIAHGPITKENYSSAIKRIYGSLKDFCEKLRLR